MVNPLERYAAQRKVLGVAGGTRDVTIRYGAMAESKPTMEERHHGDVTILVLTPPSSRRRGPRRSLRSERFAPSSDRHEPTVFS